jgi:hypothetical protein
MAGDTCVTLNRSHEEPQADVSFRAPARNLVVAHADETKFLVPFDDITVYRRLAVSLSTAPAHRCHAEARSISARRPRSCAA